MALAGARRSSSCSKRKKHDDFDTVVITGNASSPLGSAALGKMVANLYKTKVASIVARLNDGGEVGVPHADRENPPAEGNWAVLAALILGDREAECIPRLHRRARGAQRAKRFTLNTS